MIMPVQADEISGTSGIAAASNSDGPAQNNSITRKTERHQSDVGHRTGNRPHPEGFHLGYKIDYLQTNIGHESNQGAQKN